MENEIINLVCSHNFNALLRKIEGYQIDLGKNYTKRDEIKSTLEPNIKDIFVKTFLKENSSLCYKVGVFGNISIYTASILKPDEVLIYIEDKKYPNTVDLDMAELNIEKTLAELLWATKAE